MDIILYFWKKNLILFDGSDVAQIHNFMTILILTCNVRIETAILGIWGYRKASDLLSTKCYSPAGSHSRPAVERSGPNVPMCCPVIRDCLVLRSDHVSHAQGARRPLVSGNVGAAVIVSYTYWEGQNK